MTIRSFRTNFTAISMAFLSTGCVVIPSHFYVADAGAGMPVYERCSLTPELPTGVKLQRLHLQATVSMVYQQGNLVRVQFDIPEGTTVMLRGSMIKIDMKDGTAPRLGSIASINPVAPARYPETRTIQDLVLPVDAPMRGARVLMGSNSSDKHYWIAAPFEDLSAEDVWISLPELSVDGVLTKFEEIHFVRRFAIGFGTFNC
jgi:hypothetical protein